MTDKIKEYVNVPVFVFLYEEAVREPVLWMVFFNGVVDAVELLVAWLADASQTYLDGLTVTVVDADELPGDPFEWM